jgi:hypothetical protein
VPGIRTTRDVEKTIILISNERIEDEVCRIEGRPVDWICSMVSHKEMLSNDPTRGKLPTKGASVCMYIFDSTAFLVVERIPAAQGVPVACHF